MDINISMIFYFQQIIDEEIIDEYILHIIVSMVIANLDCNSQEYSYNIDIVKASKLFVKMYII